jgi:hypothetical protein
LPSQGIRGEQKRTLIPAAPKKKSRFSARKKSLYSRYASEKSRLYAKPRVLLLFPYFLFSCGYVTPEARDVNKEVATLAKKQEYVVASPINSASFGRKTSRKQEPEDAASLPLRLLDHMSIYLFVCLFFSVNRQINKKKNANK